MTLRLFMLVAILLVAGAISAQDDDALVPDEPRTVTIDGDLAPTRLTYDGTRGEVIRITVRDVTEGDPLDTVVDIVTPDGDRLAYNDDHLDDDDTLAQTDSRLDMLILPLDGVYTINVDSYGGIFDGTVEVLLERIDPFGVAVETDDSRTVITATLPRYLIYTHTITIDTETTLTITVRDLSAALDPRLVVRDEAGTVVAENDDHNSDDLALDVFDSRVAVTLAPGMYALDVLDFLGRAGKVEIVLE